MCKGNKTGYDLVMPSTENWIPNNNFDVFSHNLLRTVPKYLDKGFVGQLNNKLVIGHYHGLV